MYYNKINAYEIVIPVRGNCFTFFRFKIIVRQKKLRNKKKPFPETIISEKGFSEQLITKKLSVYC